MAAADWRLGIGGGGFNRLRNGWGLVAADGRLIQPAGGQCCATGAVLGAKEGDDMALSYKTRRRLALLVLCIGLPAYIVVAVTLVDLIARPSVLVELAIYLGLGVVWILPLKPIFLGIGQPDPDADKPE